MQIDHRTEIEKLTFRALALRQSEWRRANARNVSFSISVRWSIYIINSVDKPNFHTKQTLIGSFKTQSHVLCTAFFHSQVSKTT